VKPPFKANVIVFDMDGVLVDVKASYRDCIIATVELFTGKRVTHARIQTYKDRGGFNNDWLLSHTLCADLGVSVPYQTVVDRFNELFFGTYMAREKWLPEPGLMARLAARAPLYIFTGRLQEEAMMTLRRFGAVQHFAGVLGDDNVSHSKPHPDGLLRIQRMHPGGTLLYLGDTVDDRRAAEEAAVPFLGVGAHSGAQTAIGDINEIEDMLK
jgi:HAD superfamily hydrolase (TIGR01548 family)